MLYCYVKLEQPDLQLIFHKNQTEEKEGTDFSSKDFVIRFREAVTANPYLRLRAGAATAARQGCGVCHHDLLHSVDAGQLSDEDGHAERADGQFSEMGRKRQKELLAQAAGLLRNVLMYRMHPQGAHTMSHDQMGFVQKFSKFIRVDNMDGLLTELGKAHNHIERNAHPNILFTDLSYRISALLQQKVLKGGTDIGALSEVFLKLSDEDQGVSMDTMFRSLSMTM